MSAPEPAQRVLLVDDDPRVAQSLADGLAHEGFSVTTASGAEEALARLEAAGFDAVVSDFKMPGRDGLWLLEQVRQRCAGARRVLISGGVVPGLDDCLRTGLACAFLPKPLTGRELAAWLRAAPGA